MSTSASAFSIPGSILVAAALLLGGCEEASDLPPPPSAAQLAPYYEYGGDLRVEMSGNVAQVHVVIDRDEYLAGGEVWAKASPYIFILSPGTRQAFTEFPGLGGVRVIVRYGDGTLLAQALLERGTLNPGAWTRALNVAAQARSEGTQRPGYMRDLVRVGEDHTTFEYNPEYITVVP
jgi:hypothetical protein